MSLKSDLSFWLSKYNIQPDKNLGQCFLVSELALSKIIVAADIQHGDRVLEIGGGTGTLTQKLLEKGAEVLAIEKDSRLALILHQRFEKELRLGKLKLVQADFLNLPFPEILEKLGWKKQAYKVVANLPYQITSPTIERLLERNFLPSLVALTIQKEVAERICAEPGNLGSLTVLVQSCAQECNIAAKFPSAFFHPAPEVDSVLLLLKGLRYPERTDIKKLRQIVRVGFSQKRKKLRKNLRNAFPEEIITEVWKKLSLPENIRAQELPVKQWTEMARMLNLK